MVLNCTHPVSGSLFAGVGVFVGVVTAVGLIFICSPPVLVTGIRVGVMVVVR